MPGYLPYGDGHAYSLELFLQLICGDFELICIHIKGIKAVKLFNGTLAIIGFVDIVQDFLHTLGVYLDPHSQALSGHSLNVLISLFNNFKKKSVEFLG